MNACCTYGGRDYVTGRIRYNPSYWDDIRIPAISTRLLGYNDPPLIKLVDDGAGSVGIITYGFGHLVEQELGFWLQIPHSWKLGSDLHPHVHWCKTSSAAGGVVWGLEFSQAAIGSVLPASTIIVSPDTTATVALEHRIVSYPLIAVPGLSLSTMLGCRVFRQVANPLDTYAASAALLEIDFHFELDAPGSRQEYTK